MKSDTQFLVFTDLDATLLDHDTYSWAPARPAVTALKEQGFPLILNSSKTLMEMIPLAQELQTDAPLVCENGALVAIPVGSPLQPSQAASEQIAGYDIYYLGSSRAQAVERIHLLRTENEEYEFKGYADWTVQEVAEHTGLPIEQAALSLQRLGTEPLHWHGSEESFTQFSAELERLKLTAVLGGRFIHVSGLFTKATGVDWVLAQYKQRWPKLSWLTIALGDSPNDTAMLSATDIAVVIPNHTKLSPTAPTVIYAEEHGPTGWNTEILNLLSPLT